MPKIFLHKNIKFYNTLRHDESDFCTQHIFAVWCSASALWTISSSKFFFYFKISIFTRRNLQMYFVISDKKNWIKNFTNALRCLQFKFQFSSSRLFIPRLAMITGSFPFLCKQRDEDSQRMSSFSLSFDLRIEKINKFRSGRCMWRGMLIKLKPNKLIERDFNMSERFTTMRCNSSKSLWTFYFLVEFF